MAGLVLKRLSFEISLVNIMLLPGLCTQTLKISGRQAKEQVKAGQMRKCSHAQPVPLTAVKMAFCPCRQLWASVQGPWMFHCQNENIHVCKYWIAQNAISKGLAYQHKVGLISSLIFQAANCGGKGLHTIPISPNASINRHTTMNFLNCPRGTCWS